MLFEMNNLQTQNSRGKLEIAQEGGDKEEDSL
jgi:hypothetical protein